MGDAVVGIIGPGRAGIGLALALTQAGYRVSLYGRNKKPVPKPLTLTVGPADRPPAWISQAGVVILAVRDDAIRPLADALRSEEHTSELQSLAYLVCRLLLEKKKIYK